MEERIEEVKNKIESLEQRFNNVEEILIDLYKMMGLSIMSTSGNHYMHTPKLIQKKMDLIGMPEVKFNKTEARILKDGEEIFDVENIRSFISIGANDEFIVMLGIMGKVLKESTFSFHFNIYSNIDEPIKNKEALYVFESLHKQNKQVFIQGYLITCKPKEKIMVEIIEDLDTINKD